MNFPTQKTYPATIIDPFAKTWFPVIQLLNERFNGDTVKSMIQILVTVRYYEGRNDKT